MLIPFTHVTHVMKTGIHCLPQHLSTSTTPLDTAASWCFAMSNLKAFKLTYALYREEDPLGEFMAFMTISPVLVAFGLGVAFLVTRQLPWAWSLLGALLTDVLCSVLKKVINQPRPVGSYREGPGMPSEHAAFSIFLAMHLSLWLFFQLSCSKVLKVGGFLVFTCWSLMVSASRHHLGVHSPMQILCGAFLGAVFGILWYTLEMGWMKKVLEMLQGKITKLWLMLHVRCEGYLRHEE